MLHFSSLFRCLVFNQVDEDEMICINDQYFGWCLVFNKINVHDLFKPARADFFQDCHSVWEVFLAQDGNRGYETAFCFSTYPRSAMELVILILRISPSLRRNGIYMKRMIHAKIFNSVLSGPN